MTAGQLPPAGICTRQIQYVQVWGTHVGGYVHVRVKLYYER